MSKIQSFCLMQVYQSFELANFLEKYSVLFLSATTFRVLLRVMKINKIFLISGHMMFYFSLNVKVEIQTLKAI